MSGESSLACQTYCDTVHPFKWSSLRTCDTRTCCRAFSSGANLPLVRRTFLPTIEFGDAAVEYSNYINIPKSGSFSVRTFHSSMWYRLVVSKQGFFMPFFSSENSPFSIKICKNKARCIVLKF